MMSGKGGVDIIYPLCNPESNEPKTAQTCLRVVIINDKQLSRNEWPMGVIKKVYPSVDVNVCACGLRTPEGNNRRVVCNLVTLFLSSRECLVIDQNNCIKYIFFNL